MTAVHDDGRALVDRLAKAIGTRVLAGEIPTGARLRQEALASEFGVSRTPVREALRMLQASGIVEVHPNPEEAICDGPQQIYADTFAAYLEQVERAAAVAGKVLSAAA